MISSIAASTGKLAYVAGLLFVVLKIAYKRTRSERFRSFYERNRMTLYQVHVNVSKLALLLAFVHGFTLTPLDWIYNVTGWLFGGELILMLGLGAYLSIKNDSKPMDDEGDRRFRTLRMVKWALTLLSVIFLLLHYKLYDWMPS